MDSVYPEDYPDQITILAEPETNDGCIYCKLPPFVFNIKFPKVYNEEQRERMAANLTKARHAQKLTEIRRKKDQLGTPVSE